MTARKKQLYILCDMEGASHISDANRQAMHYGSELWQGEGRALITSDVKAVCEAAIEFGIDEVIINDEHDNGHPRPNLLVGELPGNVRVLKRPPLPGSARKAFRGVPFGLVFVGQHARYGGGGFAAHNIQSPPLGEITLNGTPVGEIGLELALFAGTPFLACIGEQAACTEAAALCPHVVGIPVKSLERNWFPQASETFPLIRRGVLEALQHQSAADAFHIQPPFDFTLRTTNAYRFDPQHASGLARLSRFFFFRVNKGRIQESLASWRSRSLVGGLYTLNMIRTLIRKRA
jgi:D-aminopeptidase